jgi:hypothetical protein
MRTASDDDRQNQIRAQGAMRAIHCMARIAGVSVVPRFECPPGNCPGCKRRSFVFVEDVCGHCWSLAVLSFSHSKIFRREADAVPRLCQLGSTLNLPFSRALLRNQR